MTTDVACTPAAGWSFLTARWTNLFLASYAVRQELLRPRLPPGLELDLRDGQAFVSLVAFDFLDTKVLGVPWPGYRNFPEINLRFYVRHGDERGVVFVREFVPLRLVAWLARTLYNEPYLATKMSSMVRETAEHITVEHQLVWNGRVNTLRVTGNKAAFRPDAASVEHYFKEPGQWGFNTSRAGQTVRYLVRHPVWETYPILDYDIDLDWERVYGPEWGFLREVRPYSTILAAGSHVAVYPKGSLTQSGAAAVTDSENSAVRVGVP
jgi:uncharacterized protein YqjF (DUF2071 family)